MVRRQFDISSSFLFRWMYGDHYMYKLGLIKGNRFLRYPGCEMFTMSLAKDWCTECTQVNCCSFNIILIVKKKLILDDDSEGRAKNANGKKHRKVWCKIHFKAKTTNHCLWKSSLAVFSEYLTPLLSPFKERAPVENLKFSQNWLIPQ